MTTDVWPIFAPINCSFDRLRLKEEILNSQILDRGTVATSHRINNKNFWDNGVNFKDKKFEKLKDVPLWSNENKTEIIKKDINTFYQTVVTNFDDVQISDSWEGKHQDKSKIPIWIKNDFSWHYREDFSLPYLQEVVHSLGLDYFSMIRVIYQNPPSIGLIHKDSGPNTNLNYFNSGGVNITLNVSTGGANLYFLDKDNNECYIEEEQINAWHFNDSTLHCTTEVLSSRIQIRIYGRHPDYKSLMDLNKAVY